MAVYRFALALVLLCSVIQAQRPFYAGLRSIGFPAVESNLFTNRLDQDADVPIEARGDGNLIKRLNQMPIDNRPFWLLNWRKYDVLRKNPQTFQLRPNGFINRNTIRK